MCTCLMFLTFYKQIHIDNSYHLFKNSFYQISDWLDDSWLLHTMDRTNDVTKPKSKSIYIVCLFVFPSDCKQTYSWNLCHWKIVFLLSSPIKLYHFVPCFCVGSFSLYNIKRINFTIEEIHQTKNRTLFNCSYAKAHYLLAHPFPGWKR